ncbi:MAG: YggS family pyridoxal phosphate-dependent enzyme [Eubacteriales bacterium]
MLKKQYEVLQDSIRETCEKNNRLQNEVQLIAVSKTQPVEAIEEMYTAGCRHFGENKVQELLEKYEVLPKDITWHMIGHLQRNKVKYIIDKVAYIHSVDSYELAIEINRQAEKKQVASISIFIEVNVAKEVTKYGVALEDVIKLVEQVKELPHLRLVGLMTIAPFVEDENENKQYFLKLQQLMVDINEKNIDNIRMYELSMGMSNDYRVAIESGATMIRVGTSLFGNRDRHMRKINERYKESMDGSCR